MNNLKIKVLLSKLFETLLDNLCLHGSPIKYVSIASNIQAYICFPHSVLIVGTQPHTQCGNLSFK